MTNTLIRNSIGRSCQEDSPDLDWSWYLALIPRDECWNMNVMPASCEETWQKFYVDLYYRLIDPELPEANVFFLKTADYIDNHIPKSFFGTPVPPSEERCGPFRDGTWMRAAKIGSEKYTVLSRQ